MICARYLVISHSFTGGQANAIQGKYWFDIMFLMILGQRAIT